MFLSEPSRGGWRKFLCTVEPAPPIFQDPQHIWIFPPSLIFWCHVWRSPLMIRMGKSETKGMFYAECSLPGNRMCCPLQAVCVCAIVQRFLGFPCIVSVARWVRLKHIVLHKAAHFNVAWIVPLPPCPLLQTRSSYVIRITIVTAIVKSVQTHIAFIKQETVLSVFGLILIRCKLLQPLTSGCFQENE